MYQAILFFDFIYLEGEDLEDKDTHLEESQTDFEVCQPTMWLGTEDCW